MDPRKFALYGGLVMLAIGVIAMIPALVGSADGLPPLQLENSYGLFLNLFPMNIVNKVVLILFGVAGIAAANAKGTNLPASIKYSRVVFFAMAALAVLGLIPQTSTLFGYWPLFGGEVIAHGVFALLGAYFGYALTTKAHERRPASAQGI